ncbi:amidase family protein [Actinokineospora soli]|uniref:Amidase family protein n=1 Tax=Actinokineospora soli TaxID=1048753 RepID=A0ABW2TH18_9PSEU
MFADVDLLMTPTTPGPPHGHRGPGKRVNAELTWAFNVAGHPAASVPAGFDGNGLPIGLQVVAPPHREDALLAAVRQSGCGPLPP